jgi:hypothetical protein
MSKATSAQIGGICVIQRLTLSCIAVLGFCSLSLSQTTILIPANEAGAHV